MVGPTLTHIKPLQEHQRTEEDTRSEAPFWSLAGSARHFGEIPLLEQWRAQPNSAGARRRVLPRVRQRKKKILGV